MNKNNSMLTTNILILIAGIILIFLHNRVNVLEEIIVLIGIMFTIPSIFSLLMIIFRNKTEQKINSYLPIIVSSIGGLVLGLFLIIKPDLFIGFLIYLFAGLLLLGGLYHVVFLLLIRKKIAMPFWFFILPLLMMIIGLCVLFIDIQNIENIIVIITGISMVCFALNSFFEYIGIKTINRERDIDY